MLQELRESWCGQRKGSERSVAQKEPGELKDEPLYTEEVHSQVGWELKTPA